MIGYIKWKYSQRWRGELTYIDARGSLVIDATKTIEARDKVDSLVVEERSEWHHLPICIYIQAEDLR